jgi:AcrR family transcriptional regulator
MARKPARSSSRKATPRKAPPRAKAAAPKRPAPANTREAIIGAFMDLLSEKSFEQIGLADVAAQADVSLADLRSEFNSTLAILGGHVKMIDRAVLTGGDGDMEEESARDRLFDVLMRRLEAVTPDREALRSLMKSASRNPGLALALNAMSVRSQQWMLTAAGIPCSGPKGMIRAQGLSILFARVVRTFVDDDEDNTRTMAELDRALSSGERYVRFLDGVCRFVPKPGKRRRRRDYEDDETAEAA